MTSLANWKTTHVDRRWLYAIAGILWAGVGMMLCRRAYGWLAPEQLSNAVPLALLGLMGGGPLFRFKFARIADRNIKRIDLLDDRASLFAFQSPASYGVVLLMIALGVTLRHSALPKPYLAVLYIGIGVGMILASLRYIRPLFDF